MPKIFISYRREDAYKKRTDGVRNPVVLLESDDIMPEESVALAASRSPPPRVPWRGLARRPRVLPVGDSLRARARRGGLQPGFSGLFVLSSDNRRRIELCQLTVRTANCSRTVAVLSGWGDRFPTRESTRPKHAGWGAFHTISRAGMVSNGQCL